MSCSLPGVSHYISTLAEQFGVPVEAARRVFHEEKAAQRRTLAGSGRGDRPVDAATASTVLLECADRGVAGQGTPRSARLRAGTYSRIADLLDRDYGPSVHPLTGRLRDSGDLPPGWEVRAALRDLPVPAPPAERRGGPVGGARGLSESDVAALRNLPGALADVRRCDSCQQYAAGGHTCPPLAEPAPANPTPATGQQPGPADGPHLDGVPVTWNQVAAGEQFSGDATRHGHLLVTGPRDADPIPVSDAAVFPQTRDLAAYTAVLAAPTGDRHANDDIAAVRCDTARQTRAVVALRACVDRFRSHIDDLEADLAVRLRASRLRSVHDHRTGVTLNRTGGTTYRSWQHDRVTADIAAAVTRDIPDANQQQIVDVITAYRAYTSTPDRYRLAALRDLGLDPRTYASSDRTPDKVTVTWPSPPTSATNDSTYLTVEDTHPDLTRHIEEIPDLRDQMLHMPLDDALREYAVLRHQQRTLAAVADHLDSATARRLTGPVTVDGTTWHAHTPRPTDTWDTDAVNRVLRARVSADTRTGDAITATALDRYLTVAAITRYKRRALTGIGLDVDEFVTQSDPRPRLRAVPEGE